MPAPRRRRVSPGRRSRTPRLGTVGRALAAAAAIAVTWLGFLAVTVPDVRPLVEAPPAETAFMRLRASQAHAEGRPARHDYRFVPYGRIAQTLKRAVLVAEDSGFWEHEGLELDAIRDSLETSLSKGRIVRGGSTITQQLAKNLYLSPSQDPIRKLRELMITHRLERLLSKRRILELYLNVVEWGDGTWGAEAASRHYFRKSAGSLGAAEAALLAGALINPNRYSPADPPRRLRQRQQIILRRMGMRNAPQPPAERDTSASTDASGAAAVEESAPPTPDPVEADPGVGEPPATPTPAAPAETPAPPTPVPGR